MGFGTGRVTCCGSRGGGSWDFVVLIIVDVDTRAKTGM